VAVGADRRVSASDTIFEYNAEVDVMNGYWTLKTLFGVAVLFGAAVYSVGAHAQKSFASADDAVKALVSAVKVDDTKELLAIFGPGASEILSSGDPVADRWGREVASIALQERWALLDLNSTSKELVIGNEKWPFPIPLMKQAGAWQFDIVAGKREVLARRIGRNELFVIGICRTYALAQNEYASTGHDGGPAGVFAQRVRSQAGKHDGLYWESLSGEKPSPLGSLAASAAAEGYAADPKGKPIPFHGYYFRILTSQGPKAKGGAENYIVDGKMTGGFALVAFPAEYGNSGIMTFIVNQDNVVFERDLGPETGTLAATLESFNPGRGWKKVK